MLKRLGVVLLVLGGMTGEPARSNIGRQAFETGYVPSPKEIAEDYQSIREGIGAALRRGLTRVACMAEGISLTCLGEKGKEPEVVSPPFVQYPAFGELDVVWGWSPVTEIDRGEATIREWQVLADSGKLMNCTSVGICELFAHTTTGGLASCLIDRGSSGKVGAPRGCRVVGAQVDGIWFSRAITSRRAPVKAEGGGRRDFSLVVFGKAGDDKSRVVRALLRALQQPPLSLTAELQASGDILGVASYRSSEVIPAWREIVTIRLQVRAERILGSDASRSGPEGRWTIGIEAISTLYLNRQNTDRPTDWQLPTRTQEHLWVEALRKGIKRALTELCGARWTDDRTLACT